MAMALSPLIDVPRLLISPRLAGVGNRLRGIGTLIAIRWYRCRQMLALAANPPADGALMWNR